VNGQQKITAAHLGRKAIVYLRQSSMAQVRDNTESTARQYALADLAADLGWPHRDVTAIDADLGTSGRSVEHRQGLRDLVAQICLGEVGAIFVLEVSRLARSSTDFGRVMDLARIADTLLIDADGVYDLRDINDRLVLGLKSTMSEVELHLMAGRLLGGQNSAAARGELRKALPAGYVYDDEQQPVIDPDAEVQAAVNDVFAAFAAVGSAHGVVRAFAGRRFPGRIVGGPDAGQMRWGRLTRARVLRILTNPTYAGAYAYGRRTQIRALAPDGAIRTTTQRRPRDQWQVLIHDHHPSYITWEQYLRHQDRLAANHTAAGARPPREGPALCQGIIFCGSCGLAMGVRYTSAGPGGIYQCTAAADQRQRPTCRSITAAAVDDAVAQALLAALTPQQLALALAAADEVADRHARTIRAAQLALERARYDADRAARAYHACEPENRLVARSLESRWESRLQTLAEAEAGLTRIRESLAPLPDPDDLATLLRDVQVLWQGPTTTTRDRKRLLRTLIADVTILPETDHDTVRIGVRWHSGATDTLERPRPRPPATSPQAIETIRRLGATTGNAALATILNNGGHRTAHGNAFTAGIVTSLRHDHGVAPAPAPVHPAGHISVSQAAERLGIRRATIYDWIRQGRLSAQRSGQSISLRWDEKIETTCRNQVEGSTRIKRSTPNTTARRAV
jgi:excisionase family DNA binding protein